MALSMPIEKLRASTAFVNKVSSFLVAQCFMLWQSSRRMREPESSMNLNRGVLKSLPKVLLHEHLDGVLRPATVIDLARSSKYQQLPTENPEELARWFHQGANQGSLPKYLQGFVHTIAVMQTEAALQRVAYEQAADLSAAGIVYFETRFAPVFHTRKGLTHQQIVSAVLKGLEQGRKDSGISSGLIVC